MTDPPSAESNKRSADAKEKLLWIRVASLSPVALLLVLFVSHEPFRVTMRRGTELVVSGDLEALREWGASLGAWAPLATSVLMLVQALAAPIPAVLITATNSLLFGPFVGGVLSIVSANIAASVCYLVGRIFGEPVITRLVPPASLERADRFLDRHGATAVLVARLVPIVPFDPISYFAGMARMPHWRFFWATLLGQIPAGMTYSYLAQEIHRPYRFVAWSIAALASLLLVGWVFRRVLLGRGASNGGDGTGGRSSV